MQLILYALLALVFHYISYTAELPSTISYAQECTQEDIDDQLIDHLLSTCPKLAQLVVRLQNPLKYGKYLPKKLLLVGPPGVGKSTIAKGIAKRIGRKYKFLRASLLVNEYKNSGPQNLAREIMPLIEEREPYVVILDEIHALTENYKKENNADSGTAEALWSILDECIKYPHILFIGTTNDVTTLPEPLKTRFTDALIEIPLPNQNQRINIIKYYIRNCFYSFDVSYFTTLAKKTKGYSGRIIEQIVNEALLYALDRNDPVVVTKKDFERALRSVKQNHGWLALSGLGKYKKFIKDHANILISLTNMILGLTIQYTGQRAQIALTKVHQAETMTLHKEHFATQTKMSEAHNQKQLDMNQYHHQQSIKQQNEGLKIQKEGLTIQKEQAELQKENMTYQTACNIATTGAGIATGLAQGMGFGASSGPAGILVGGALGASYAAGHKPKSVIKPLFPRFFKNHDEKDIS